MRTKKLAADLKRTFHERSLNTPAGIAIKPLLICNMADRCTYNGSCFHRRPHESYYGESCGPGMECYEGKILSKCVPLVGRDHYYTTERVDCPHCKGRGHEMVQVMHRVPKEVDYDEKS